MNARFALSWLLVAALLAGCTVPLAPISAPISPASVEITEVIVFQPEAPGDEAQAGSCWTNSLAVWRADAWRCMVENSIYDPCFATGESIICGANPATNAQGFDLTLTEPLPAPDATEEMLAAENHAWLVELADGTLCTFATGATGGVDNKRINYLCTGDNPNQMVALLGDLEAGTIWKAEKALLSMGTDGPKAQGQAVVNVRTIWR
jgi:hypothetical protein